MKTEFESAVLDALDKMDCNAMEEAFFDAEFSYDSISEYGEVGTFAKSLNLTNIECIEEFGGENMGTIYYTIFKFETESESCFVKFDGSYYSYSGSEFESMFIVRPVPSVEYQGI